MKRIRSCTLAYAESKKIREKETVRYFYETIIDQGRINGIYWCPYITCYQPSLEP